MGILSFTFETLMRKAHNEMATLCSIQKDNIGIIIEIESADHGYMNTEEVLPDTKSPAHIHIYGKNKSEPLGKINITGPCPQYISEVNEYRPPKNSLLTSTIKSKFVTWCNTQSKFSKTPKNNWDYTQELWNVMHYTDNRSQ